MNLVRICEDLQMIQLVLHDESEQTDACLYCENCHFDVAVSSVTCVFECICNGGRGVIHCKIISIERREAM